MTVCIAASCREGDSWAIVLCADGKGSTPLGSREMMLKVRVLLTLAQQSEAGGRAI